MALDFSTARPSAGSDTDPSWNISPYSVVLGGSYASFKESLIQTLAISFQEQDGSSSNDAYDKAEKYAKQMENNGKDKSVLKKPSVSDASIGGNDAINPYPAFCVDDDIVPDMNKGAGYGMGRVYQEIYDSQQVILWMTPGVTKFTALETYFAKAYNAKLHSLQEDGYFRLSVKLGTLIGSGLKFAFELPWYPIIYASKLLNMGKTMNVSDYCQFYQCSSLYYRSVNTILSMLAVNMGLFGNNSANVNLKGQYINNMPEVLREGPDIFKIINKRLRRLDPNHALANASSDDLMNEQATLMGEKGLELKDNEKSQTVEVTKSGPAISKWFDAFTGAFKGTALGGNDFIGFRVDKSVDAAESFSNSTKTPKIAEDLNGQVGEKRELDFNTTRGSGAAGMAANAYGTAKQYIKAFSSGLKEGAIQVVTGNGYYDIPEMWASASTSGGSHSFKFTLRANYGDPVSIYQNIYIPLACLLAFALPRATGAHTYTSPYVLRCYCKGRIACPYGIVESLSVVRGDSEFGWNHNSQPTVVNVNLTIKDLSPVLYMHLADRSFLDILQSDTKFNMYLDTLAGIGLKERYFRWDTMKRRFESLVLEKSNTWLSPTYWGTWAGDTAVVKTIAAFIPFDRVSRN